MSSFQTGFNINALNDELTNLNVSAPCFVPGSNVFASSFVPAEIKLPNENIEVDAQPITTSSAAVADTDIIPDTTNGEESEDWEEKFAEEEEMETKSCDSDADDDNVSQQKAIAVPKKKPVVEKVVSGPRKEHINIVFIGHVDAGKSTIGGHLLYLTGMVDQRTLEKYEREAKEKNRETWYLSWALDTNTEEREKGKTVEVGRAYFETEKKHFTVLDAPGHKSFVPNMIGGASQADLAILVISARRGEFETGFEKGGQTREHAMLVKTAGVKFLIVLINKMDDPTVCWDKARFTECRDKLTPYLRRCGFNTKVEVFFMPCSGLTGAWLRDSVPEDVCSWYRGPTLIDYLEGMTPLQRLRDSPLRMPVADKYRDMGTVVIGKIESGSVVKGQTVTIMPNRMNVEVLQLWSDDVEVEDAEAGDNVKMKLKNVEEEDALLGFVICPIDSPCSVAAMFDAQIVILEHKSIICAGYCAVLHLHCAVEEVRLKALIMTKDKKTGERKEIKPRFIKQDDIAVARFEVRGGNLCVETFKQFPQMGRFTLRDEGRTIAMGKVLKVLASSASGNAAGED